MSFLYPKLCNDPLYVQKELSDKEFFSLFKSDCGKITEYVLKNDYAAAWDEYLLHLSRTIEKRTRYRISEADKIKNYVDSEFSSDEAAKTIKEANDLIDYRFKLMDPEPFVFSKNNIPWNETMGNSTYNQLFLTYMGYIPNLAIAYIITKDTKYVTFFADVINSFIDTCPVPKGDDFTKDSSTWTKLGVAIRLSSILNTTAVMFNCSAFDCEIKKRIIKHMVQTARYVKNYNADNGNHVVSQMTALIFASAFFEELKEADEWFEYAISRLNNELSECVYPDGVQAEASPNYHIMVLSELTSLKALSLNGYDKIPENINSVIHDMFVAQRDMCTPHGDFINLGDTSCGKDVSKHMKLASCLFKDEFINDKSVSLSLSSICCFGVDITKSDDVDEVNLPKLTVYKESGFLSYRNKFTPDADFVFMHAGEGINGHAHADTLSAIIYANGRNILTETGNAPYEWNKKRKYALSTAAHSTVRVDKEDSHVRMLHWLPMRTAPTKIWVCEETDDYVLLFASHYGYHRFPDPVVHTRKLIYIKDGGYYLIVDLMNAEKNHEYEVFFHLPPSEYEFNNSDKSIRTKFDNANVLIYPINKNDNTFEVINTACHVDHTTELTKPTYKINSECTGNKYFATLVIPYNTEVPQVSVKIIPAYKDDSLLSEFEALAVEVDINGSRKTIAVNNISIDPREFVNHEGNPDSDAHMKGKKNRFAIKVLSKEFNDEVKIF